MAPSTKAEIPSVVREIESRVEQLIADHKQLTKLNNELIQQRDALQAAKEQMQERIVKLERELTMAQLKSGLNGRNAKSNARARGYINRLLREVDKCITLLSSPEGSNIEEGGEREKGTRDEEGTREEKRAREEEATMEMERVEREGGERNEEQ